MAALTFPIISKLNVPVILSFKWLCFFKYWNMALLCWLTPDCVRKDLSYSTYGAQAIHRHAIFMGLAIFFNFLTAHWAMFVHLSMPSLDASCFSMAETAALGDEPQVCGASAGCSGQSQPAQPSQDSCWGLMEHWITSQAAAAAHMNLQNSSDLAECPGPYAHSAIHSLSCVLRVGWGWAEEWVRDFQTFL